jgi:hypothetical protein
MLFDVILVLANVSSYSVHPQVLRATLLVHSRLQDVRHGAWTNKEIPIINEETLLTAKPVHLSCEGTFICTLCCAVKCGVVWLM